MAAHYICMMDWKEALGIRSLLDTFQQYVHVKLSLLKGQLFLHAYKLLFLVIGLFIAFSLWGFALLFSGLVLAHYLNTWLQGVYLGYILVAAVYFLLGVGVLRLMRCPSCRRAIEQLAAHTFPEGNEEESQD